MTELPALFPDLRRETHQFTTIEAWLTLRLNDVTSTDVAALMGRSPYCTPFELYHRKRGGLHSEFQGNELTAWGNAFEPAIAHELARRHGWEIRPMKEYVRLPDHRIGSSFDYLITNLDEPTILEIKNVGWRQLNTDDGWIESDFGYEAPSYIEYQCQSEMLVSGIHRCIIGACIGGNEERLIHRPLYPQVADEIIAAVDAFWQATEPPSPDYYRDGDTIARLNGYAEPDKIINADARMIELMTEYREFSKAEKIAEEEKKARKAELLTLIGDAEKVLAPGLSISASMVASTQVAAYERKSYRDFRITEKRKLK